MADGSVTIEFNGDTKGLDKDINGISGKVEVNIPQIEQVIGSVVVDYKINKSKRQKQ